MIRLPGIYEYTDDEDAALVEFFRHAAQAAADKAEQYNGAVLLPDVPACMAEDLDAAIDAVIAKTTQGTSQLFKIDTEARPHDPRLEMLIGQTARDICEAKAAGAEKTIAAGVNALMTDRHANASTVIRDMTNKISERVKHYEDK